MLTIEHETPEDKNLPANERGTTIKNDPIVIRLDDGTIFGLSISDPNEAIGQRIVLRGGHVDPFSTLN